MSQERHATLAIHPVEADSPDDLLKRGQIVRRTRLIVIVLLILLALGAGRTIFSRMANAKALDSVIAERGHPFVKVAQPTRGGGAQTLALPGTLQGFVQSPVAARAGGYLKRWYKDIGSRVAKGELLAELETPETDQQLSQAIAARAQTAASLDLTRSTVDRWEALRKKDAVSQQELEERRSAFAQAQANLAAADANVERLRQLENFKRVVAPFAGVITRRNVDIGDLVDPGGGRPLFLLAQTDPLRVYVNVPQAYAQLIKAGQPVNVTQSEMRGQVFKGEVMRTSASIDATTRSMQVEVALPNKDGLLLPGAYVQVALPLPPGQGLTIPGNALMFRAEGIRVATVDSAGKVSVKPVRIGRNFGERVELLEGIGASDQLVLNPPDSMAEGDMVTVVADAPAKGAGGAPGKPAQ